MSSRFSNSLNLAAHASQLAGWSVSWLDPHSGYLVAIGDGTRQVILGGGAVCPYPVNTATAVGLARDKGHAALLLGQAGIPVPDGGVFFTDDRWRELRGPGREVKDAIAYADRCGWPVFVKPVDGSRGAFAGLSTSEDDLASRFAAMANRHPVALVQQPIDGSEWRVVVFDGTVEWAYRRADAVLQGDGKARVVELLAEANGALAAKGLDGVPPEDGFLQTRMREIGAGLETVLPAGTTLCFTPRRNVAGGGGIAEMPDQVPQLIGELAVAAAAVLGLRLAGVDIIVPPGAPPIVLEVNGAPALGAIEVVGGRERVLGLWTRILAACLADPALCQPMGAA